MKLPGSAVILLILFFTPYFYSQNYSSAGEIINTSNYAEAPLQKGLPEIEPGREYSLKIKAASFAWITPVGGFEQIYFIKGNKAGSKNKYWVFIVSSGWGNSLIPVVITNQTAHTVYGYAVITVSLPSSFSFPLKLIYSKRGNDLKYTWPSDINSSIGNNGEIIPVIKIGSKI